MASRIETDFKRLLGKSESMVGEEMTNVNWRLEQYMGKLQDTLSDMEKSPGKLSAETLAAYNTRLLALKRIIEAKREVWSNEAVVATECPVNLSMLASTNGVVSPKTLDAHLKITSRHVRDMRAELLQGRDSLSRQPETTSAGGLRNRGGQASNGSGVAGAAQDGGTEDLEDVLRVHRQQQDEIAEDMIKLARQLKDSQRQAKITIDEDSSTLQKSTNKAQDNADKLHRESDNIQKQTRKACSYWTWIMIIFVAVTFLAMVVFIRLVPK